MDPFTTMAALVLVGVALTFLSVLLRNPRRFPVLLPILAYLTLGALLTEPRTHPWLARSLSVETVIEIMAVLLFVHVLLHRNDPPPSCPEKTAARYLQLALVLAAAFLLYNLDDFIHPLLTWESPTIGGFGEAFRQNLSVLEFTIQRFFWDNGLMSAGDQSLLYGAPTYALFKTVGFSTWTLRISSVIATLFCTITLYDLARRYFGAAAGAATALLFAVNTVTLFYGRYGTLAAANLFTVAVALWCAWYFLEHDRSAGWFGGVAGLAFFIATLQYSPGRIVILVLIAFIVTVSVLQPHRLLWQRLIGLLLMACVAFGVWQLQAKYHRQHLFLFARGEQFFHFKEHPDYIDDLFGHENCSNLIPKQEQVPGEGHRELAFSEQVALLVCVVRTTVPQYLGLVLPRREQRKHGVPVDLDPPLLQLYFAPLAIFIAWGVAISIARLHSIPHLCLLILFAGSSVPLLLTNRVDTHRASILVIPIVLWMGLGAADALRVMLAARVPAFLRQLITVLLPLVVLFHDVNLMLFAEPPRLPRTKGVIEEIWRIPGAVAVGGRLDHRDLALIHLSLLERARRNAVGGTLIPEGIIDGIHDELSQPVPLQAKELRRMLDDATVILAPANVFRKLVPVLQQQGVRVAERGEPALRFLRLDLGEKATGIPDNEVQPLPTIVLPPTPTPIPLRDGPLFDLTAVVPLDVSFDFAKPQTNRTWDGMPIRMGGVHYEHGFGTHANTRMRFAVPFGASAFQAIVGISDRIRDCDRVSLIFQVRDHHDQILAESPIFDASSPPIPIHAAVRDKPSIWLVTSDAGNGFDCDHGNWALPAFVLEPQ